MSSSCCDPDKASKVDELLDTLSNRQRRELVHFFENFATDRTASLDAIVAHVDSRIPSTNTVELRTAFHHTHLPMLDDRGWLAFDARAGDVHYYGHEDAEQLLTEVAEVFAD